MTASTTPPGALAGLLIADFSRVLAGPYLTMLLGDLGATVIKVEAPAGDSTRLWGPPWHNGTTAYYSSVNRNKRGLVLDLSAAEDRALGLELARRADVLVENLLPGKMEAFGLGYEELATLNPQLVYCSISGFGSQPGGAELPGYDLLGQAMSGLMSITGPAEGPPYKVGVALVDVLCGLHGALGILAALHGRAHVGRGQHVEVDLLSSALSALVNQASGYLLSGVVPGALGNVHPSVAPYEVVHATDGDLVLALGSEKHFRALCAAFSCERLADDERFSNNSARVANRPALIGALDAVVSGLSRDAIVERLRAVQVPCGPVNNIAEAFAFAEEIGLQPIWHVGDEAHVRSPIGLSETPAQCYGPPPAMDQHGDAIRAWLRDESASPPVASP
jgi:crotonobetainyl-CoA:carnitine CoA-transferase CaiB-like acyl-CoA transferase